jgi:hypothetical protein
VLGDLVALGLIAAAGSVAAGPAATHHSTARAPAATGADIEALMLAWAGMHDSSEAVTVGEAPLPGGEREQRISTLVAPVQLPWLGPHVLYLEELAHDEPDAPRRQLLVKLEPAENGAIRAGLFTFVRPGRWTHLDRRPQLLARLALDDLRHFEGCDLLFTRQGSQFRGTTSGHRCLVVPGVGAARGRGPAAPGKDTAARYVDYQLVLDPSVYWYRRRLIRAGDGEIEQEVVGFNWFELNEARLFTCRIDWSASGHSRDLKPLVKLDLHDKGGRGELVAPDGRHLLLTLHSQDWPFAAEHDSLVLLLSEPGAAAPLASSWAVVDDTQISMRLPWLRVRCGAVEPSLDEVRG